MNQINSDKNFLLIQISSGRGPVECSMVCMGIASRLLEAAHHTGLSCRILNEKEDCDFKKGVKTLTKTMTLKGSENLMRSVVMEFQNNEKTKNFLKSWTGTILWIGKSPYREKNKRKNWYVSLEYYRAADGGKKYFDFHESEISFETFRSSGPGGQHVNKTESAVRARHLPTGITVEVSEERSQFANRRTALKKLREILKNREEENQKENNRENWKRHNRLERGNPVKIFQGEKFKEVKNESARNK